MPTFQACCENWFHMLFLIPLIQAVWMMALEPKDEKRKTRNR